MGYYETLDLSQDLLVVQGLDSATLKIGGFADVALSKCVLSEPITWRELDPSNAQVLREGTLFVWPKSRSARPPIGSVVVDSDGTYWTVWQVTAKQHVETWEPKCLNLSIVATMDNTATILKATYTHGRAGEAKAVWAGLFSGKTTPTADDTIPAHFQPSMETAKIEFSADWSEEVYRVYFKDPVPMEAAGGEYRLVDNTGQRFRVMRYYDEERIDKLPIAVACKITEGQEYFQNPSTGP